MTLFYWLCVPTVSGGACRPASRADVAVAFLHVTSVDVALLHVTSVDVALLHVTSVAGAVLHAGGLLSVEKSPRKGAGRRALSKRAVYFSLIK